jgi:hypothetical protein
MFNILNLFNWSTWFLITLCIIFLFWLVYGGKQEYEFIGVQPLSTPKILPTYTEPLFPTSNPVLVSNQSNSNKGEDLVAEALQDILNSHIQRNIRPSFLCNPETGKNMEIDCFCEEYAVAVEYNGVQHYKFPSVFYKNEKDFNDQVYRDKLKKKLCDENDIYLIVVPYWVDMFGNHDEHIKDENPNKKIQYVSREIRYKRIYNFLYDRLRIYFETIFPQEENEHVEEDYNSWNPYVIF